MNIQLLLTGNEILSGDTIDTNSQRIARALESLGLPIHKKITLGDEIEALVNEIQEMSQKADLVIINGGLGPTVDDLTMEALSTAASVPLTQHPDALDHLTKWAKGRDSSLTNAQLKQSYLPQGAAIIPNPKGSAVGANIEMNGCLFIATPGVPAELDHMLWSSILHIIQSKFTHIEPIKTDRLVSFGLGESQIQQMISDQLPDWPNEITLGFRAHFPYIEVKLTYTLCNKQLAQVWREKITHLLSAAYLGEEKYTVSEKLLALLVKQQKQVVFAESCTGGRIACELTKVSGASKVLSESYITYSNHAKTNLVGVDPQIIEQHGSVSEQTAIAMLDGALKKSQADVGAAVTGIAGPSGATKIKPVGLVCIAWGNQEKFLSCRIQVKFARNLFQEMVAAIATDLICRFLQDDFSFPNYIKERELKAY